MAYLFENGNSYGVGFAVVSADGRRIQLKEFPGAKLTRQGKALAKEFLEGIERDLAAGALTAETYALRFPASPNLPRLTSLGVKLARPTAAIDVPTVAAFSASEVAKKRSDNERQGTIAQVESLCRAGRLAGDELDPLATLLVSEVDPLQAERFKERAMARGVPPDRINRLLKQLTGLFGRAMLLYDIPSNPFKKVSRVKPPKNGEDEGEEPIHADPFLSQEIEKLLATDGEWEPDRDKFQIAYSTGLRRGELFGLKIGDIDLAKRKLYVRRSVGQFGVGATKTASSKRTVDLSSVSIEALRRQLKRVHDMKIAREAKGRQWAGTWLFPTYDGSRQCPRAYVKTMKCRWPGRWPRFLLAAGVAYKAVGQTRHTYAVLMYQDPETDPRYIAQQMGHVDLTQFISTYSRWRQGSVPAPAKDVIASLRSK